jgi:hypothetical protein
MMMVGLERGEGVMEMAQRSRLVWWEATDVYSAMRLPPGWETVGGRGRSQNWELVRSEEEEREIEEKQHDLS